MPFHPFHAKTLNGGLLYARRLLQNLSVVPGAERGGVSSERIVEPRVPPPPCPAHNLPQPFAHQALPERRATLSEEDTPPRSTPRSPSWGGFFNSLLDSMPRHLSDAQGR